MTDAKICHMLCILILVETKMFFSTDSVSFGSSRTYERLKCKNKNKFKN